LNSRERTRDGNGFGRANAGKIRRNPGRSGPIFQEKKKTDRSISLYGGIFAGKMMRQDEKT